MTYDDRNEGEIRRRAAWLLAMLAVVAALLVVLMVFFLGSSKGAQNAAPNPNYGEPQPTSHGATTSAPHTTGASGTTSGTSGSDTSSGPPPKASCPSSATCKVDGDIAGTLAAINQFRAHHGLSTVRADITPSAEKCALSSGSDCPQDFVWLHVDNLSGKAVVTAIQGFSGTDNLLDADAKQFAIGWAYDPSSHSSFCAVIRLSDATGAELLRLSAASPDPEAERADECGAERRYLIRIDLRRSEARDAAQAIDR